jgi:HD-like signal output (HDOD) protein
VAHACVAIARQVGKSAPQNMFSLGMLHDSGRLALMQAISHVDPEGKFIEGLDNRKSFFAFLRKHNLNCGVSLMTRWEFGKEYIDVVRYNYDLNGAKAPTRSIMIVNLANLMARAYGYGNALDSPDELDKSPAKGFLFSGDSDLTPIVDQMHLGIEQMSSMLV